MRYEEDKIFGAYMDSLLVEKKKGLPPWLKKDGEKDEKDEKDEKKDDKKSSKKKGKKGLPPWLKGKGKGKKVVKENMNDPVSSDSEAAGDNISVEDMRIAISEMLADMDDDTAREVYNMLMMGEDGEGADGGEGADEGIPGVDYVKNMETSEPAAASATAPNADRSTARYMQ